MKQQRFPRRVGSRRAVIIGVAGLVTASLAGGALAWLRPFSHISPVKPASTQRAEPSPTVALGTAQPFECLPGTVVVAGSSVLAPFIWAVARDYRAKCPNGSIEVEEGGSLVGLAAIEAGTIQIASSEIFKAANQKDLVDHQIMGVIYTLIVNRDVTGVAGLSTAQLRGIYAGELQNWNQVGGPDLPIAVVSHPIASETRAIFQHYVLKEPEAVNSALNTNLNVLTDAPDAVISAVQQTAGALSYVALQPTWPVGMRTLQIDGHDPTASLAAVNAYPFWSIAHLYTKGPAIGIAQWLIDDMFSAAGQAAAAALKFFPLYEFTPEALTAHQSC